MNDANLEVLRKLYDALAAGDFGTVLGLLPDDVSRFCATCRLGSLGLTRFGG